MLLLGSVKIRVAVKNIFVKTNVFCDIMSML